MKKKKDTDYVRGYKIGQQKLAQKLLDSSLEKPSDFYYLLGKLTAVAEGLENV